MERGKHCKYCKLTDHYIDNCPDILCKKCNDRGHPHWKCQKKRNVGGAFEDRLSVYMEVVEEEKETKSKMKKSISDNHFGALDQDEEDLYNSNSIFHFLQYNETPWAEL